MTDLRASMEPAAAATEDGVPWHRWRVAPDSGFEVRNARGDLGLVQIDRKRFLVGNEFRFGDEAVVRDVDRRLVRDGVRPDEARQAVDDARTFTPRDENPTDLASIPRYMRWFESSYGAHTLAAIIHDDLIQDTPNPPPLQQRHAGGPVLPRDDEVSRRAVAEALDHVVGRRPPLALGRRRHPAAVRARLAAPVGDRHHVVRVGGRLDRPSAGRPDRHDGPAALRAGAPGRRRRPVGTSIRGGDRGRHRRALDPARRRARRARVPHLPRSRTRPRTPSGSTDGPARPGCARAWFPD